MWSLRIEEFSVELLWMEKEAWEALFSDKRLSHGIDEKFVRLSRRQYLL